MCLIIVNNSPELIERQVFTTAWENNSDGGGIMYATNGKVNVFKTKSRKKLWKQYCAVKQKYNVPVVIHFRIGTSGEAGEYNIHPFKVNDTTWFCHNGILSIKMPDKCRENDTQYFNDCLMKGLPEDFIKDDAILNLIRYSIGTTNKFVFLNNEGLIKIVNESMGHWIGEDWFSNYSYERYEYVPKYIGYDWNKKEEKKDAASFKSKWEDETGFDEWLECEACGQWEKNITYSSDLNIDICEDCNSSHKAKLDTVDLCEGCGEWKERNKFFWSKSFRTMICGKCIAEYETQEELF